MYAVRDIEIDLSNNAISWKLKYYNMKHITVYLHCFEIKVLIYWRNQLDFVIS